MNDSVRRSTGSPTGQRGLGLTITTSAGVGEDVNRIRDSLTSPGGTRKAAQYSRTDPFATTRQPNVSIDPSSASTCPVSLDESTYRKSAVGSPTPKAADRHLSVRVPVRNGDLAVPPSPSNALRTPGGRRSMAESPTQQSPEDMMIRRPTSIRSPTAAGQRRTLNGSLTRGAVEGEERGGGVASISPPASPTIQAQETSWSPTGTQTLASNLFVYAAEEGYKNKVNTINTEQQPQQAHQEGQADMSKPQPLVEEDIIHAPDTMMGWRDAGSYECVRATPANCHGFSPYWVEFSPDCKVLASCGHDSTVKLWRIEQSLKLIRSLSGHRSFTLQCVFTPNGEFLLSVSSEQVFVWYVTPPFPIYTSKPKCVIGGLQGATALAISPDANTLVIGCADATLKIWGLPKLLEYKTDANQYREITNLYQTHVLPENKSLGHKGPITRIAFAPDNNTQLLTASADSRIMLWDVVNQMNNAPLRTYEGHKDKVLGVCWHENGQVFVSCSHDKTILIWRLDMPLPFQQLNGKGHEGAMVYSCIYIPNSNRLLTVGYNSEFVVWDTKKGKVIASIQHVQIGAKPCTAIDRLGVKLAIAAVDVTRPITLWEVVEPPPWWKKVIKTIFFWLPDLLSTAKTKLDDDPRNIAAPSKRRSASASNKSRVVPLERPSLFADGTLGF